MSDYAQECHCNSPALNPIEQKFVWDGERYHPNSDQQKMVANFLIRQYSFRDSDHILDVGCGAGDITFSLSQHVPHGSVIGLDPSPSMIAFAKQTFEGNRISFQLGKASELSYHSQFDVITSFSALHWEPKQKEALLCFKEALKPCGSILLAIPGPDPILRQALAKIKEDPKWNRFLKDFISPGKIWSANEYAQLLLETGFLIKKIEVVDRPYFFNSAVNYADFVAAMLPHLACISREDAPAFLNDIVDLVKQIEGSTTDAGQLIFHVKVLEVIAISS